MPRWLSFCILALTWLLTIARWIDTQYNHGGHFTTIVAYGALTVCIVIPGKNPLWRAHIFLFGIAFGFCNEFSTLGVAMRLHTPSLWAIGVLELLVHLAVTWIVIGAEREIRKRIARGQSLGM